MTSPKEAKKEKDREKAFAVGESLGFENYEVATAARNPPEFGLCSTCSNMQFARTEFRVRRALCVEFDFALSASEPIIDCTNHEKIGSLTLQSMWNMATMIDPPGRKIGFKGEEENND